MVPNEFEADIPEYYYEGPLPVLAGRFRRKLAGYFDGNIPSGTRVGREIRLIKLPQLTWVYGYLIRDAKYGIVVYVSDSASLAGVEGFHPVRSGREIRQSHSVAAAPLLLQRQDAPESVVASLEDGLDELTDILEIKNLGATPQP